MGLATLFGTTSDLVLVSEGPGKGKYMFGLYNAIARRWWACELAADYNMKHLIKDGTRVVVTGYFANVQEKEFIVVSVEFEQ